MCGPASAKAQTCGQVLSLPRCLSRVRSFIRCRLDWRRAGEPSWKRDGVAEFGSSPCSMPLQDTCVTLTSSSTSRRSCTFFPRGQLLYVQLTLIGARVGISPTRKSSPTFRGPLRTAWSTFASAGHRAPHGLVLGGARAQALGLIVRGQRCWGLPGLYRWEKARLHEAKTLLLHFLAMADAVSCRGGGHLLERPEDPGCFLYASIWDLPETQAMEERTGTFRQQIHQCMSGCSCKKATCLSGTLEGMDQIGALCDGSHSHEYSLGVDSRGVHRTRKLLA